MKRVIPFLVLCLLGWADLLAQDQEYVCDLDSSRFEDIVVIGPQPLSEETPEGGIPDTACVNTPYQFEFAISIPDTPVTIPIGENPLQVPIEFVAFDPDTAITYDPPLQDFDYVCDPPSCRFEQGTQGCVKIFGTASPEEIGDHELFFVGAIDVGLGIPIGVEFPGEIFPGSYIVTVDEEGGSNCLLAGVNPLASQFSITNRPNPLNDHTQVLIESKVSGEYEFRVFDMLGKTLHRERLQVVQGENTVDFDATRYPEGMYLFSVTDGKHVLTKKMIVNR